ncbi:MAG: hypothetical protein ACAI35_28090 [Candidatus Methylacidiphilales bacterium]
MGTTYTVTKTVKRWRSTQCTACSTDFAYLQTHIGVGKSGGKLWSMFKNPESEAEEEAEKALAKLVNSDAHCPTSCPSCGSYNQDVYRQAQIRRATYYATRVGFSLLAVWGASLVIGFCLMLSNPLRFDNTILKVLALYCLPVAVLSGPILYLILRWQDINTPAHKLKRIQKRENRARLRSEFEGMTEEMSPEEREYSLRMIHWSS